MKAFFTSIFFTVLILLGQLDGTVRAVFVGIRVAAVVHSRSIPSIDAASPEQQSERRNAAPPKEKLCGPDSVTREVCA